MMSSHVKVITSVNMVTAGTHCLLKGGPTSGEPDMVCCLSNNDYTGDWTTTRPPAEWSIHCLKTTYKTQPMLILYTNPSEVYEHHRAEHHFILLGFRTMTFSSISPIWY